MPNRIIKDSINESESLSECTVFATDLYKRLITYADDYGRFNSDTAIIRARLYPREYETVGEGDIINALVELAGVGKIEFYTPEVFGQKGKKGVYGVFPNWKDHQRIRDSKAKTPEPYDTSINDWYLRRFVSLDMKAEIIERDGFKCRICGKFLTSCRDSRRFAKLGHGLYHIDHIVPCQQGGRSTLENLRLTCPECNLRRKKKFSFKEILEETLSDENTFSRQSAANCRNSPPESNPNPIQSESVSEYEDNATGDNAARNPARHKYGSYQNVLLSDADFAKLQDEFPHDFSERIDRLSEYMESTGKKYKNHLATIRNWAKRDNSQKTVRDEKRNSIWGASGELGEAELDAIRQALEQNQDVD